MEGYRGLIEKKIPIIWEISLLYNKKKKKFINCVYTLIKNNIKKNNFKYNFLMYHTILKYFELIRYDPDENRFLNFIIKLNKNVKISYWKDVNDTIKKIQKIDILNYNNINNIKLKKIVEKCKKKYMI